MSHISYAMTFNVDGFDPYRLQMKVSECSIVSTVNKPYTVTIWLANVIAAPVIKPLQTSCSALIYCYFSASDDI